MAPRQRGLTADRVAQLVHGELVGDPLVQIAGTAPLDQAGSGDCSMMTSARYREAYATTNADVVLVDRRYADLPTRCGTRVLVADPGAAFDRLISVLSKTADPRWEIHPSATIGRGTRWRGRISVGAGAVIGSNVILGHDCTIGSHVVIGDGVTLGHGCRIETHAAVMPRMTLGDRVVVRQGAQVGGDGFGFVSRRDGPPERKPHAGVCQIGDDVEIGTNATVDRGRVGDTILGAGTKLDAQVHIGHNVRMGEACLVMAQVGVAGSSTIGDRVQIGGQAGITDNVTIGDDARVAAQAGVIGDIAAGSAVSGYPARTHRQVLRQTGALKRLEPLVARIEALVDRHAV